MFSGSGDDSDTILSADSPVSANSQTRFSLKLLYFFSGAALLALLLSVFVQTTILYAVFSAGIFTVFFFVWLWAVFEADVVGRLKITASKASVITASVVSVFLELICVFLAGTSLVYAFDLVLNSTGGISKRIVSYVHELFPNITDILVNQSETISWIVAFVLGVLSYFVVYLVMKRLIATRHSAIVKKEGLSSVLLFALASALWVFVPLLPLYLTNINNVTLLFVLLLAAVYMIGTLAVYFIALFFSRSALASFGVCVIAWIGLSMSEGIITTVLAGIPYATVIYSAVLLGVMVLGGFGILKAAQEFELSSKKLSKIIIALVAVLLVINIVPIVSYNITSADAIADASEGMTFVVDDSLDHPNIYWIHAESMVDETVLEKYWGEDTFGFTEKLEERGFYVNHEAYLTGLQSSSTTQSLSSLFLPDFYDSNINSGLSSVNHAVILDRFENHHEFIHSFEEIGYNTVSHMVPYAIQNVRSPSDIIYYYDNNRIVLAYDSSDDISEIDKVIYYNIDQESGYIRYSTYPIYVLLSLYHLDDKLQNQYYSHIVDIDYVSYNNKSEILLGTDWIVSLYAPGSIISSLQYSLDNLKSPSLTLIYPLLAHDPYYLDENGNGFPTSNDISLYYGMYLFSEKILLYVVDMILSVDPNAIIIIQGDHGPYDIGFEGFDEFFDMDPNYKEYHNHVLSAVRIPEQYQTEDYPEAIQNPRNIVRYLVNSYVGENYEYIPAEVQ